MNTVDKLSLSKSVFISFLSTRQKVIFVYCTHSPKFWTRQRTMSERVVMCALSKMWKYYALFSVKTVTTVSCSRNALLKYHWLIMHNKNKNNKQSIWQKKRVQCTIWKYVDIVLHRGRVEETRFVSYKAVLPIHYYLFKVYFHYN